MLPWRSSSTSRESTVTRDGISSGSLGRLQILTNPAFEQERGLRQLEMHAVMVGAGGIDAGDVNAVRLAFDRVGGSFHEIVGGTDVVHVGDAGATRDGSQAGRAIGSVRRKAAGGEQAAVVEDNVD